MSVSKSRLSARKRARVRQQKVIAARAERDRANIEALVGFFAAADRITDAQLDQARRLADIRGREGSLTATCALVGISSSEARKLLALLDGDSTDDPHEPQTDNDLPGEAPDE